MIAAVWLRAPARARLHALRELYRRFFGENTPDAAAAGFWPNGCHRRSARNSSSIGISMSSAATPARPIASIMAPPPMSMRSTPPEMRRWGGASSRQAFLSPATSCSHRRSRSRPTKGEHSRSPTGFRRQRIRSTLPAAVLGRLSVMCGAIGIYRVRCKNADAAKREQGRDQLDHSSSSCGGRATRC